MSKKLRIFKNGVQLSEIDTRKQEKILSVVVYDQYVNYVTDPIVQSHEFMVRLLYIQDSDVKQLDFDDIESVEDFTEQPITSI